MNKYYCKVCLKPAKVIDDKIPFCVRCWIKLESLVSFFKQNVSKMDELHIGIRAIKTDIWQTEIVKNLEEFKNVLRDLKDGEIVIL